LATISGYLAIIADEPETRGYRFDRSRIGPVRVRVTIPVTMGQLGFETGHLRRKLEARAARRDASDSRRRRCP